MSNAVLGAIFVRRIRPRAEQLTRKPRNVSVPLSEDELARAYRGLDGEVWPDGVETGVAHPDGLASLTDWTELAALATKLTSAELIFDAIILAKNSTAPIAAKIPGALFLGYDVGFYCDEFSVFSSIFHEALHSPIVELRNYASQLNSALLFSNEDSATAYCREREQLRAVKADVENQSCYPVAIFGRPHSG